MNNLKKSSLGILKNIFINCNIIKIIKIKIFRLKKVLSNKKRDAEIELADR